MDNNNNKKKLNSFGLVYMQDSFVEAGTDEKKHEILKKTTNSKTTTVQQKIGLKRNNNKTLDLNWLNIIYHRLILLLLRQLGIVKWCFLIWELSALFKTISFLMNFTDGQIKSWSFKYI